MNTVLDLGNSTIQNGIRTFDVFRSRREAIDTFVFTFREGLRLNVEAGTRAEFYVNLPGGEPKKVFHGSVDRARAPFRARDKMAELMKPINQAFINTVPQEVLNYVLQREGIGGAILSPQTFPKKNFVASAPSFYDLVLHVNKHWSAAYSGYFDLEGIFRWHSYEQPGKVPVFAYGENIIRLEYDGIEGRILTILVPEIDHSRLIGIEHPEVDVDEVLVDAVHHYTNDRGGARTEIHFSVV